MVLKRLSVCKFLQGEYGLAEAVAEIKEGKKQIKTRDRLVNFEYEI